MIVNCGVVGADLEKLLDAGTVMGTEVMVEVHSLNELEFALSRGAMLFLVNMWDRITGKLFSDQVLHQRFFFMSSFPNLEILWKAKMMATMMPLNACAAVAGDIHTMRQVAHYRYIS